MLDLLLTVFRYIFLAVLYIFIFQLIRMMFRDLKVSGDKTLSPQGSITVGRDTREPANLQVAPPPGTPAGLVTLASGDPGLQPGTVFPLEPKRDRISLGRGARNTVTFSEPFASVEHAYVYGDGGQYWLEDRGSKNGTFLNGVRINGPTVLADGDRIKIGDVTLQFVRWAYEVEPGDRSGSDQEAKRG